MAAEGAAAAGGGAGHQGPEGPGPDWAGLPAHVLVKVAGKVVAQDEAAYEARLKRDCTWRGAEVYIQKQLAKRKRDGNCLFVFARVCKEWRKAQLKVGGRLRTRVLSDVLLPGSVALVKWALAEGCPRMSGNKVITLAPVAAGYGHHELVQWLIQEQDFVMDWHGKRVMAGAARSGNLELVRWLRGEGFDWDAGTCSCAAEAGRLGVLQWLRTNGCPWDARTCKFAAVGGHLQTLRWARENGCDWDAGTCEYAAQRGHLQVLQWLRANGCPWNADTCNAAAQFGHLATLRWARENGCDWDAEACEYAAQRGHLEVLQYLRANGCPWNADTCRYAVNEGHVETLRWARENGCPWSTWTRDDAAEKLGYTDDLGNLEA